MKTNFLSAECDRFIGTVDMDYPWNNKKLNEDLSGALTAGPTPLKPAQAFQ